MDEFRDVADRLEASALQAVAVLRRSAACGDWLDSLLNAGGDLIGADVAGYVWNVSDDKVRARCAVAALTNRPLGVLIGGAIWVISLARLLDLIEREDGRPALLAAQTRAEKIAGLRCEPLKSFGLRLKPQSRAGEAREAS